ncbi:hypothetical protein P4797_20705 [Priestia aryabhattai]|uniref:hypothetical protein n=1 Tax=Priestia aryabhattai TaxID=412384 RepID=UPI002E1DDA4A|nr:hypothetical protein [Priestia aryabhattai]
MTARGIVDSEGIKQLVEAGKVNINIVEKYIVVNGSGSVKMNEDRRNINGFNNAKFGDNAIIQGDSNVQTNNKNQEVATKAFADLFLEINHVQDEAKKQQAQFFAEQLEEAYKNEDKPKAEKVLGFLQSILTNAASLATVATLFGITL